MLGVHTQCFIHSEEQNKTKQRRKKKKEKYIKKIDVVMGLGPMYPKKKKKKRNQNNDIPWWSWKTRISTLTFHWDIHIKSEEKKTLRSRDNEF